MNALLTLVWVKTTEYFGSVWLGYVFPFIHFFKTKLNCCDDGNHVEPLINGHIKSVRTSRRRDSTLQQFPNTQKLTLIQLRFFFLHSISIQRLLVTQIHNHIIHNGFFFSAVTRCMVDAYMYKCQFTFAEMCTLISLFSFLYGRSFDFFAVCKIKQNHAYCFESIWSKRE